MTSTDLEQREAMEPYAFYDMHGDEIFAMHGSCEEILAMDNTLEFQESCARDRNSNVSPERHVKRALVGKILEDMWAEVGHK